MQRLLKLLFPGEPSPEELRNKIIAGKSIADEFDKILRNRCNPSADNTLKKGSADAFFDELIALTVPEETGSELLADSTPYVATSVAAILKMLDVVKPDKEDVLCDVGAGLFRIPILVHLLTGMHTMGVEMDTTLTRKAQEILTHLNLPEVTLIEGDASSADLSAASIFAFNLPFEDETFRKFLALIHPYSREKKITIYPFCWHYYFWDIAWLKPINYGSSEEYYFVSR